MMLVKASKDSEAGVMPSEQELAAMGEFNEQMVDAGVMLAGEGLHPSSSGARVTFEDGKPQVTDGPFTETKELIAGFWLMEVASRDEAIEWAKRVPFKEGQVELRKVFEAEDFGDEFTPELREQEEELRERTADNR
jgi:hypothetical protein